MTDDSLPSIYTPAELETRKLILHVRSRKWRYLTIAIVLGVYFFYLFKYKILDYSATATFIVNDRGVIATALGLDAISTDENFTRVYELANSISTQKHLIEKFGLLKHYDIDTTKEFYIQKTIAMIRSKILVGKSKNNTVSIVIRDRHRYLAADMANEIVTYVGKLNHDYYVSNIRQRLEITKGFIADLDRQMAAKTQMIDSLIGKIGKLSSQTHNEDTKFFLMEEQRKLIELTAEYKQTLDENLNKQKTYAMALQALKFQNLPTITPIQQAMPSERSIVYTAALYSLGAMIAVLLILIMQGYFYISYKHYIRLLLTGK